EGRFMTACFATWQKGRQKLRVANAGQSQPLLYKDHRCGKIELTGFPLGIYEDVAYDEWGVTLEPGNILVFHSDGITETANSEGQFFGTTRLRELIEKHHALTAAELADKILGEVDWFSRSAPLSDDRTLVVMKVDRKSTRLNSSHVATSYAVFCLKKKNLLPLVNGVIIHQ